MVDNPTTTITTTTATAMKHKVMDRTTIIEIMMGSNIPTLRIQIITCTVIMPIIKMVLILSRMAMRPEMMS
jgi:hypothetical protein